MSLVPLKTILDYALEKNIAVGAYNVHTPHEAEAAIRIHEIFRAPCIIQFIHFSASFMNGVSDPFSKEFADKCVGIENFCKYVLPIIENSPIPIALNLDHGTNYELAKCCVDNGFSGVMIDGSGHDLQQNIELTARVVDYAHKHNVSVEAELGTLSGREDETNHANQSYTDPTVVVEFVKKTGIDCLAISYGTVHGPTKGTDVKIRKEISVAAMELMRWNHCVVPLVSHGSSLVKAHVIDAINRTGGAITAANGVPLSQLLDVIPTGICKINIGTDIRLGITRAIREYFVSQEPVGTVEKEIFSILQQNPDCIDERVYLNPMRGQLVHYQTPQDCKNIIHILQQAIMQTIGELIINFGYADAVDDMMRGA